MLLLLSTDYEVVRLEVMIKEYAAAHLDSELRSFAFTNSVSPNPNFMDALKS